MVVSNIKKENLPKIKMECRIDTKASTKEGQEHWDLGPYRCGEDYHNRAYPFLYRHYLQNGRG
jgi:hypothetical protein